MICFHHGFWTGNDSETVPVAVALRKNIADHRSQTSPHREPGHGAIWTSTVPDRRRVFSAKTHLGLHTSAMGRCSPQERQQLSWQKNTKHQLSRPLRRTPLDVPACCHALPPRTLQMFLLLGGAHPRSLTGCSTWRWPIREKKASYYF